MEKTEILRHLRSFIQSKENGELDKKTAQAIEVWKSIKEEDVVIGNFPKYFWAYISCNSTGVGTSSFGGTETRRTIARDYVTDEYLFVDGDMAAAQKGFSLLLLKDGENINFYSIQDTVKLAKQQGYRLHAQEFHDLNFAMSDHRLNRHKVNVTKGPFSIPIRPIYAIVSDEGQQITVGYVYEKDGMEYIIVEPEDPAQKKKKRFALWLLLGFIFPPIWLVALFFWLVKSTKERWIG